MNSIFRPFATTLIGLACLVLGRAEGAVAQKGSERNFTLSYAPGGPSQNGYADAVLDMSYYFAACPTVELVLRRPTTVHMQVGAHRYWFDGRLVEVPASISPPAVGTINVQGVVRGNGIAKNISTPYAVPNPGCFNNGTRVGEANQFWPAGTSDAEKERILNQFGFDPQSTLPPLRNSAVENYFQNKWAAERRDSVTRATAVRNDSIQRARAAQARIDSARAAQSRSNSGSSAAGGTSGAASAAGAAGSAAANSRGTAGSANGGASSANAAARAQASRDSAKAADAEADRQHAAAVERNRREQQIQDSIQTEQLAQATAQGMMAAAQLLGMMFEGLRGTGLMLGASYSSGYFPGDKGAFGITISGYASDFVLPFMEINFPQSTELGSERPFQKFTLGSVIPKTGFTLPKDIPIFGGQYKAHAAWVYLQTHELIKQFNYTERNRNMLMLGLTHFGDSKLIARLDMTLYGGKPVWGAALGKAF